MKTIGEILKSARVRKKYSLNKLESITRIKKGFIDAIEKENWGSLPPFPTVLGFVKSLAGNLGISEKATVAVLKRDYPPKPQLINPKPDISSKFVWSPKLTFAVGVGIATAAILGYLIFQYVRFTSPPSLRVDAPKEGQIVTGWTVEVSGVADSDAKITVNNQPVIIDQDGKFTTSLEVAPETEQVEVKAISRSGKETTIRRKIQVQ